MLQGSEKWEATRRPRARMERLLRAMSASTSDHTHLSRIKMVSEGCEGTDEFDGATRGAGQGIAMTTGTRV